MEQILSDVVDIMGCQGMKSKGLLDTNMNTMMTRLEMFVPELAWHNCKDKQFKMDLLALVHKIEYELQENLLREWNIDRFSDQPARTRTS